MKSDPNYTDPFDKIADEIISDKEKAPTVTQVGLTCEMNEKGNQEVATFTKRVDLFNQRNLVKLEGDRIKLDIIPYEEGEDNNNAHYKLRLEFPSREVMRYFWANPQ